MCGERVFFFCNSTTSVPPRCRGHLGRRRARARLLAAATADNGGKTHLAPVFSRASSTYASRVSRDQKPAQCLLCIRVIILSFTPSPPIGQRYLFLLTLAFIHILPPVEFESNVVRIVRVSVEIAV